MSYKKLKVVRNLIWIRKKLNSPIEVINLSTTTLRDGIKQGENVFDRVLEFYSTRLNFFLVKLYSPTCMYKRVKTMCGLDLIK